MTKRIVTAALLGGLVFLLWTTISWVLLPFHTMTFNELPVGVEVVASLDSAAVEAGVYTYPGPTSMSEDPQRYVETMTSGPHISFLLVGRGMPNMLVSFIVFYLFNVVMAGLAALLLGLAADKLPGYGQRVLFVLAMGGAASVAGPVMEGIWWNHPFDFALLNVIDVLLGFVFMGLILAWQISPKALHKSVATPVE